MQAKYSKKMDGKIESGNDRFVVLRNGVRVSDEEYSNKKSAQQEYDHWNGIIKRWPDGSKLEIVNLNKNTK